MPPPVVVASADGRTPAVSFAADADPFSAGGLFAPPSREDEPPVVVHDAPDAAVLRGARRARSTARGATAATSTHQEVLSLLRERDGGPDTGSLVRPYVALADADAPSPSAAAPSPTAPRSGQQVSDPRPARRARRSGGPLDRIIDSGPAVPTPPRPVQEWHAPWTAEDAAPGEGPAARSLFEPTAQGDSRTGAQTAGPNAWAPPPSSALPSRKALRARERAGESAPAASGAPSARSGGGGKAPGVTGRRLAKSGVLAVTAVGVVAASAPNAFSALGWHLPTRTSDTASAALVGLTGSGSLPSVDAVAGDSLPRLGSPAGSALLGGSVALSAPAADDASAARKGAAAAQASAAEAAHAGAVASGAGRTLVDVARAQVLAEAARKAKIAQQVSRNVIRDPRSYAKLLLAERGWSDQFSCLNLLWNRESGWNYQAYNPSSGAYGIPQALPGSKMATIASDWRTNPATQITWGLNYIAERYGTPCGAWGHSQATGWY